MLSIISYLNDSIRREGKAEFYEHGKLTKGMYFSRGNLVGNYIEYYNNGKPSLYICFDSYGDTIFIRKYKMDKKVLYEHGEIDVKNIINQDSLEKFHSIIQYSLIVRPPHSSIAIDNYFVSNNKIDTLRPISRKIIYGWMYYFQNSLPVDLNRVIARKLESL